MQNPVVEISVERFVKSFPRFDKDTLEVLGVFLNWAGKERGLTRTTEDTFCDLLVDSYSASQEG